MILPRLGVTASFLCLLVSFFQTHTYALLSPSSCSSIRQIPHNNNKVRKNIHLIHPSIRGATLRKHTSPTPSTKMTSTPNTKNINGIRKTHNVSSIGNNNGVLDAGAIGKNGAIPVPGSRNLVNFSIVRQGRISNEGSSLKLFGQDGNGSWRPHRWMVTATLRLNFQYPFPGGGSLGWRILNRGTIATVGLVSKGFLKLQRNVQVEGLDKFLKILEQKRDRGVITGNLWRTCS
jgi:hypothetical protein